MSLFTMINRTTKEIGEEKEFKDYIEAGKYCKENYGEGWESKHEPFHFTTDFRKFLKEGTHESIKTDDKGNVTAIITEGDVVTHCGHITLGELDYMRRAKIKTNYISKIEFLKLHNELVS